MTVNQTTTLQALVEDAVSGISEISAGDAVVMVGGDHVFVDLRDPREIAREGKIPDAFHCPRGMLEFWLLPDSPYHKDIFAQDKQFIFYCASGWRSALSTGTAQALGLTRAAHIKGGFAAWKAAGGGVEAV